MTTPLADGFALSSIKYKGQLPWDMESDTYRAYDTAFYYALGYKRALLHVEWLNEYHFATQYARHVAYRLEYDHPRPKYVGIYDFFTHYMNSEWGTQ